MFDGKIKTIEYGSLVVTHECNKHCKFCIDKYRGQAEYITLPNVEKALQFAKEKGLKEILIVGGEPTMHPNIIEIAKLVKQYGFKSILTSNYTKPSIIKQLDGIIDCFNISFYNQKNLPMQCDFVTDITITSLIHKQQLNSKLLLDEFINKFQNYGHLKFSTLSVCNEWTKQMQQVNYLDTLEAKKIILFDEIEGLVYRNCIIKRYDKLINNNSYQSLKFHVSGEISQSWERSLYVNSNFYVNREGIILKVGMKVKGFITYQRSYMRTGDKEITGNIVSKHGRLYVNSDSEPEKNYPLSKFAHDWLTQDKVAWLEVV